MKLLVLLLLPCLSLSELVPGFSKCREFFLNTGPPRFTPQQGTSGTAPPQWFTSVKEICQCLLVKNKNVLVPKYLYATLYNTDWRIPIYSAYVFKKSKSVGRVDRWYIEPQLDGYNNKPCMAAKRQKIIINQAVKSDYKGQDLNKPSYDRGHLYPVQHTYDHISMLATSTLTNAAPQDACFNRLQWYNHEKDVIKDLESCDSNVMAYVVTGVVPADHNKQKLKDRVTVSKYYWRATCCEKNGVYTGKGYFGPDGTDMTVKELTIKELQTQLTTDYGVNAIVIFPGVPPPPGPKRLRVDPCN